MEQGKWFRQAKEPCQSCAHLDTGQIACQFEASVTDREVRIKSHPSGYAN